MGTHPIFESDFDCLTDMNRPGEDKRSMTELIKSMQIAKKHIEPKNINRYRKMRKNRSC